tara:strand:+ start:1481 stop:2050 length:570 start_codon:yes stop_codon:yes gene_type:complete
MANLETLIEEFKNQKAEDTAIYEEPGANRLDAPVPGQSLTDDPGNSPWEHPPKTASVEEAVDLVYEQLMKEKNLSRLFTLLRMGIPVEALVKVITFSGFLEGRWSVDVAKLLEPIVAMMITGEASLAEIKAKINLGDAEDTEFFKEMTESKRDMDITEQSKELPEMPSEAKAMDLKSLVGGGLMGRIEE